MCPTSIPEWVVAAVGTVLLLFPHILYDTLGLPLPALIVDLIAVGFFFLVYGMQKYRIRKDPTLALPLSQRMRLRKAHT